MIRTDEFQETMGKIKARLDDQKGLFVSESIDTKGVGEEEDIDSLITTAADTTFKLLVMGRFSAGKSAFINVLLGEKLLPEGALPMTALITEIYYGKEKKVTMYPRPGKWKGGNEPFEIEPTLKEIKKYSTLNNKSGINTKEANRIDSSFEKMVVHWPLEILKDGVAIIDSPGTDDPYSNDYIVESYVPFADAVLYCINGTNSYAAADRNALESICQKGFRPIIVTTYFDVITEDMEEEDKQDYIDTTIQSFYSRHTEKEYCHYVNSKQGLDSKINGSQKDFVESGYCELEQFLGKYLTEEKGKEKISGVTAKVKLYNENQKKRISGMLANLDTPLDEFNSRITEVNKKLEQARAQGDLLVREFRLEVKKVKEDITALAPSLYDQLYDEISLDDFEPDTSFSLFHPSKSSKQIAEECSKEIELRNKRLTEKWNESVLSPKVAELNRMIFNKMKKQVDQFSEDIKNANISLGIETAQVETEVSGVTRVAMFAWALATGDWITALLGGTFGAAAFGRVALCQFAAGVVLGIVALFTPVGLPALIIASIGGMIGGVGWNASKAAETIKKKTVSETKKELRKSKEKIIADTSEKCMEIFDMIEAELKEVIAEDIREVEKTMEDIQKERETSVATIQHRKETLVRVIAYLGETNAHMDGIRERFQI